MGRSLHAMITNKRNFYEGGKRTLANRDFYNANSPFEHTATMDRDTLRARARWLHENNPIMANIDKAILNNVIGKGIHLQSKTGNKKLDDAIESRFKQWWDECDITGRLDFGDFQRLVLESRMVDGEIFIYKRIVDRELKLQLIEADALDVSRGIGGISVDESGKPTRYHFRTTTDLYGNTLKEFTIPAKDIINYFRIERPTQYRGISEYKQAILDIKNFSAFQSATVRSARANAEIAYTIETDRDAQNFGVTTYNGTQDELQEINGLMVYYLRPGEKVAKHDNKVANAGYDEFVTNTVRMIATARNISYELAFRDYSKVNFASSRASLIQDNKRFDYEQEHIVSHVLNKIYKDWLEVEVLSGRITINPTKWAKNKHQFIKPRWSFPKRDWVDPTKDIKAIEKELELNLTTMTDLAHERGQDLEEILATKQKEQELLKKYGLPTLQEQLQLKKGGVNA